MIRLPLADRTHAGQLLAKQLAAKIKDPDVMIVALPRGGVPVAHEIAQALRAPLDVLMVRKLGVPGQEELAFGAIASGKERFIDHSLVSSIQLTPKELEQIVARQERELERGERLFRGHRPPLQLQGRTVILVDDGMATGSTMLVAIHAARRKGARKIVVAAPVASVEARDLCRSESDACICLAVPDEFHSVGEWYQDFSQISDTEVRRLLLSSG